MALAGFCKELINSFNYHEKISKMSPVTFYFMVRVAEFYESVFNDNSSFV